MLLNDFFELVESDFSESKLIAKIKLNEKHQIYSGHFPGNPITPGVVQMQIVKELLEYLYQKPLKMKTMSRCKFLQILNPHQTPFVDISIEVTTTNDILKISATGEHNATTFFKLNATYQ